MKRLIARAVLTLLAVIAGVFILNDLVIVPLYERNGMPEWFQFVAVLAVNLYCYQQVITAFGADT